MYLEYSFYAVPAILITGLVAWLFLKWKGQTDRTTIRALLYGTATAILISLLVPVAARLFYHRAGLSVTVSLVTAFASLAFAAAVVLYLAHIIVTNKTKEGEKASGYLGSAEDASAESAASHEGMEELSELPCADQQMVAETPQEEPLVQSETLYESQQMQPVVPYESQWTQPEPSYEDQQILSEAAEIVAKKVDTVQNIDKIGDDEYLIVQDNVNDLLNAALDYKIRGDYPEAVSCYRRALEHIQEKELLTWVVIDLCGLAKIMKNTRIIQEVLDSKQGEMLDSGIKTEILNNI